MKDEERYPLKLYGGRTGNAVRRISPRVIRIALHKILLTFARQPRQICPNLCSINQTTSNFCVYPCQFSSFKNCNVCCEDSGKKN